LRVPAAHAAERASVLALEQSVEMPLSAVRSARVRDEVVARVQRIDADGDDASRATLLLAAETVGRDPAQLVNMLMGNSSLHDDVELVDVELPAPLAQAFGGPCG